MAGLSDADQGRLPVSRFDPRRADRARPRAIPRPRAAHARVEGTGHPGVVELLLQEPHDGAGTVSGARFVHSVDEVKEHVAAFARRGIDHAPWAGVLRLRLAGW